MKVRQLLQAITLAVAASLALGCVPGLKSAKSVPGPGQVATNSVPPGGAASGQAPKLTDEELDKRLPPPPPFYKPPGSPDQTVSSGGLIEPAMKEEINETALRFAKEIPNVKHVKTCFSKLYGGWYLNLYVQEGKKTVVQQYSWEPESKEWKVLLPPKEVPLNLLEHHLKGEVADEKCYLLK